MLPGTHSPTHRVQGTTARLSRGSWRVRHFMWAGGAILRSQNSIPSLKRAFINGSSGDSLPPASGGGPARRLRHPVRSNVDTPPNAKDFFLYLVFVFFINGWQNMSKHLIPKKVVNISQNRENTIMPEIGLIKESPSNLYHNM